MTMTDTADARATATQCIELAEAGSEMVRVTVNLPEAATAVPEIKQRMLDAGCTAPLIGDFHYNGHILLTKFPECAARSTSTASTRATSAPVSGATSSSPRSARWRWRTAGRCASASTAARSIRSSSSRACRRTPIRNLGMTSEEIINECMVLSAVESTALAIESGLRKDQIIISCKTSRPRESDQRLPAAGVEDRSAAAPRAYRSRDGRQGARVVGVGDGRAAERRHRRHDPRLADAAAGGRSARRGLRRVRAAAGARPAVLLAERHGVSRLRPDDEQHVSGARGARAGLHPRADARVEDEIRGRRDDDARRHGLCRQRPRRIEGGEHRDQPAGHGEAPNCPIYIDGEHKTTLRGTYEELSVAFQHLVDGYVDGKYARR